jgi:hypothetical protein
MDEAVEGLKSINGEITELAENLIDEVTNGNPDESSELAQLDLNDEKLHQRSEEILASFDEEVAEEMGSNNEDDSNEEEEKSSDIEEIEDLEAELLGSGSDAEVVSDAGSDAEAAEED